MPTHAAAAHRSPVGCARPEGAAAARGGVWHATPERHRQRRNVRHTAGVAAFPVGGGRRRRGRVPALPTETKSETRGAERRDEPDRGGRQTPTRRPIFFCCFCSYFCTPPSRAPPHAALAQHTLPGWGRRQARRRPLPQNPPAPAPPAPTASRKPNRAVAGRAQTPAAAAAPPPPTPASDPPPAAVGSWRARPPTGPRRRTPCSRDGHARRPRARHGRGGRVRAGRPASCSPPAAPGRRAARVDPFCRARRRRRVADAVPPYPAPPRPAARASARVHPAPRACALAPCATPAVRLHAHSPPPPRRLRGVYLPSPPRRRRAPGPSADRRLLSAIRSPSPRPPVAVLDGTAVAAARPGRCHPRCWPWPTALFVDAAGAVADAAAAATVVPAGADVDGRRRRARDGCAGMDFATSRCAPPHHHGRYPSSQCCQRSGVLFFAPVFVDVCFLFPAPSGERRFGMCVPPACSPLFRRLPPPLSLHPPRAASPLSTLAHWLGGGARAARHGVSARGGWPGGREGAHALAPPSAPPARGVVAPPLLCIDGTAVGGLSIPVGTRVATVDRISVPVLTWMIFFFFCCSWLFVPCRSVNFPVSVLLSLRAASSIACAAPPLTAVPPALPPLRPSAAASISPRPYSGLPPATAAAVPRGRRRHGTGGGGELLPRETAMAVALTGGAAAWRVHGSPRQRRWWPPLLVVAASAPPQWRQGRVAAARGRCGGDARPAWMAAAAAFGVAAARLPARLDRRGRWGWTVGPALSVGLGDWRCG